MAVNTRRSARIHGAVPMAGLFAAAFLVTWVLERPSAESDAMATALPSAFSAASSNQDAAAAAGVLPNHSADTPPPAVSWEPTLYELAVDQDPGTRTEAQTLMALLGEEGNMD
jgi:hypothetical protein